MKKILILIILSGLISLSGNGQKIYLSFTDTMNFKEGFIVIAKTNSSYEKSTDRPVTSVNISVFGKDVNKIRPDAVVGLNKVIYKVCDDGIAKLLVQKGKIKLTVIAIGYQTLSAKLRFDLKHRYDIKIYLNPVTEILY